jgi:RNA polymerase sigma factor (sigma-70 family)
MQRSRASAWSEQVRRWPSDDPDAYVRRIVVNANRDRFRKPRVSELLTDSLPTLEASAEQRDDRAVLVHALMKLSHGQRAAVVLRYWLDLSETQTAAVLGCSVGNVKSQTARGLAKLRASVALVEGGLL